MMSAKLAPAGWALSDLLASVAHPPPVAPLRVTGLALDSRAVRPGDLFLATSGIRSHGLEYAPEAVSRGAVAVVWEPDGRYLDDLLEALRVPAVQVEGLTQLLGRIAARFYAHPSHCLYVVGVTGTDGKTSCSHFIADGLSEPGRPAGLMGTLGYGIYGSLTPGAHTTPDALRIQRELAELRDRGVREVAMEVSSHGMEQGRVNGVQFDVAVFTNLSRDHLDYHGNEAAYGAAKQRLFQLPALGAAVINGDDPFGVTLLGAVSPAVHRVVYGLAPDLLRHPGEEYLLGSDLELNDRGLRLRVRSGKEDLQVQSGLLGGFNAYNLLATLAVLRLAGLDWDDAVARLARIRGVPGRMERFGGGARQPLVVVDYAHTPRALEHALGALRPHCSGELWCVFGAGGDRDQGKRPLMGRAASRLADRLVLTNDNPRHEEPLEILRQIQSGLASGVSPSVIPERSEALAQALAQARPGDVVLVAGKGHEDYQEVGEERRPFSDRDWVRRLLAEGPA